MNPEIRSDVPPYSVLARVYDHLMAHVEYEAWTDYIHAVFGTFGSGVRTVLDAGCGTGRHMQLLRALGYETFGYDRSHAMVRLALDRKAGPVWQGDLRAAAAGSRFDAVICLYDTVHYLEEADLPGFFRQCRMTLMPGGLLIFDAVTESFLRNQWADYSEWGAYDGWTIYRRSRYDRRDRCQHTHIDLAHRASGRRFIEHHRQWSHPVARLRRIAVHFGFEVLGVFDSFTFDPGDERSDRNHFILKRGAQ